jgi:hypothetical protein
MRNVLRSVVPDFRRTPGLAIAAVLTLGLGIGGTTAVFGVVDALLIHPLPYPTADRLYELFTERLPVGTRCRLEPQVFQALRQNNDIFPAIEGYQFGSATLTGDGEAPPKAGAFILRLRAVPSTIGRVSICLSYPSRRATSRRCAFL